MKILLVIDDFGCQTNGLSISTQRFKKEFEKLGHEVRILGNEANGAVDYPLPVQKLPFFQKIIDKQGFQLARSQRKMVNKAVSWAEAVILETPFPVSAVVGKVAAKKHKKLAAMFHIYPENILYSVPFLNYKWSNHLLLNFAKKIAYRHVTDIFCPTEKVAHYLRKNNFKQKLHVISNGISNTYLVKRPEQTDHCFTILCIGRFSHEKKQEVLLRALKYLPKNIRVIFAGQGPLEKNYRNLAKHLPQQITFSYYKPQQLQKIMQKSDLVVHCADIEIEGMACMEAFASGCVPIIADAPLSSTSSYALTKNNLFPAGDSRALAKKILFWKNHPKQLQKMSQEYQQYAHTLSIEKSAKKMLNILQIMPLAK
ncbi:glycosyltransferase [Lactobacillus sp. PV012]|uniref:glycosyltransferase n=1 Tax=Lactobacillus sp. PV012 TaxID=2594494 RepID=UPI00223F7A90|nr:glycosyltransferase [Lactobacillus sp. PV012]QNQ82218.1 glycosyltransferase family 4 protein [Lactobacillus sp. PV012]